MRAAIAILILALAAPSEARERLIQVPFVGCPADGQTGQIAAPKPHRTPSVPARAAARLAYYATDYAMVLAPRGWHCLGLYGSNGQFVIVTPERHTAEEFFRRAEVPIRGPAIQMSVSVGGTSGRFSVAPVVARYFPRYRSFLRSVTQEMQEMDPGFRSFPTGGFRTDIINRRTPTYLRFTTPARRTGEGAQSRLLPGNLPIEGFRKIVGSTEEPDMLSADVRLPVNQSDLIEVILADAAR